MNRWIIEIPKRKISSTNFNNHVDDIEQSGEKVSGIIRYGIKNNKLIMDRHIVYPMFRIQPDVTQSSFQLDINESIFNFNEEFIKVSIDGILHIETKTPSFNIVHHFYPSTTKPIFYETVDIENKTNDKQEINYKTYKRINVTLGCEGYIVVERKCNNDIHTINPNEKISLTFGFLARFANESVELEDNAFLNRVNRVNELLEECDFTCGNDIIDTMFAFSKIRAGESIFNTRKGRVHSPGGTNYYAAIWCNDQLEYSTPWFGFTGDKILNEAATNAIKWYIPYMSDELFPIPSSIISEGTDYWNGAKDRGDASMFLFGASRYMLETGNNLDNEIGKELDWAYRYVKSQVNNDNVVISDTDELEGRISSGINLATSSLSYGGLIHYASLLKKNSNDKKANECIELANRIKDGIESYFGFNIKGYNTYAYHKDCNVIRTWDCLPIYMRINNRKDDTIKAILENLWNNGSCYTTEGESIMWDRSAIYFIMSMFRCGDAEEAFNKLLEMSSTRLLTERVPYVVEAYPECNMRHLSAESALYCRIITDGLIDINLENGVNITPHVPSCIKKFSMKNIVIDGKKVDINYIDGKTTITNTK